MTAFDPRTGQFIQDIDPGEMVYRIDNEIDRRRVGFDPLNWPSRTEAELLESRKFWCILEDADLAERKIRLQMENELHWLLTGER